MLFVKFFSIFIACSTSFAKFYAKIFAPAEVRLATVFAKTDVFKNIWPKNQGKLGISLMTENALLQHFLPNKENNFSTAANKMLQLVFLRNIRGSGAQLTGLE